MTAGGCGAGQRPITRHGVPGAHCPVMPATAEALTVVLLAIVPGYLARAAWSRWPKTYSPPTTDLAVVIQSIAASVVIQLLVSPLTIVMIVSTYRDLGAQPWRVVIWITATLVVSVVAGFAFGKITNSLPSIGTEWIRLALSPTPPTIWDISQFDGAIPDLCLLVIEYSDGRRLAGAFADRSKAVTSPQRHGLFLEQEWHVDQDGIPTEPIENSGGIDLLDLSEVRVVHVFVPPENPPNSTIDA
jgi:hypothetical protein